MKSKNNIKKGPKQCPESTRLTHKIHDPGYETGITPYKSNQNKLWSSIPSKSNIEGWSWNKFKKKDLKYF
jgi:hypothetical protein